MTEPMLIRVHTSASPAEAHKALTEADQLRIWLAEHAEVELPGRYAFWGRTTPEGDAPHQQPLHVDEHIVRFGWRLSGADTTVEISVAEAADQPGTLITLTQTGLPSYAEMVADAGALAHAHTFWALSLANLVDHLEGRPLTPPCDFTTPTMRIEFDIAASSAEVFASLADSDTFSRWFGARLEIEPRVGGRWAMGSIEQDPTPGKVLDLRPAEAMKLGWGDGLVASWELADSGGRTHLTFVQSGFDEGRPPYGAWMGWLSGFAELRRYHELPNWRPIWRAAHVEGMPEDMLTFG